MIQLIQRTSPPVLERNVPIKNIEDESSLEEKAPSMNDVEENNP